MGRGDGALETWDLLDSLSRPTVPPLAVASAPLSSISFRPVSTDPASAKQQLIAVGDGKGSLHIMEVPDALRVASAGNEGALLSALVERECGRVSFTLGRAAKLETEKQARDARLANEAAIREVEVQRVESEFLCAWHWLLLTNPPALLFLLFVAQRGTSSFTRSSLHFLFLLPAALKGSLHEADPAAAAALTHADLAVRKKKAAMAAAEAQYQALQATIMEQLGLKESDIAEVAPAPAAAAPPSPGAKSVAFGRTGAASEKAPAAPSGGQRQALAATGGKK